MIIREQVRAPMTATATEPPAFVCRAQVSGQPPEPSAAEIKAQRKRIEAERRERTQRLAGLAVS